MKEPKLEDFIGQCYEAKVPRASIMADLVNPATSAKFYSDFIDEIIVQMRKAIMNSESFEKLIDEISTKASENPAIDMEDRLLDINDRTKLAAPSDPVALKLWRKENYWKKHVSNVVQAIDAQAKKNFQIEGERYKMYVEGDDTIKTMLELGFF